MKNPFQTVYCEDCEWYMLAMKHDDPDDQVEYARCKAKPRRKKKKYYRQSFKTEYRYCE
ncbi:hypothetical protein LCGC14_2427880, partial [marine sediment metagenome]